MGLGVRSWKAALGIPEIPLIIYMWTGKSTQVSTQITANVPSHGTAVFRISASAECVANVAPPGMVFNTVSLHRLTSAGSSAS